MLIALGHNLDTIYGTERGTSTPEVAERFFDDAAEELGVSASTLQYVAFDMVLGAGRRRRRGDVAHAGLLRAAFHEYTVKHNGR